MLEWEERGIWYTPPDAELDVEGTSSIADRISSRLPVSKVA